MSASMQSGANSAIRPDSTDTPEEKTRMRTISASRDSPRILAPRAKHLPPARVRLIGRNVASRTHTDTDLSSQWMGPRGTTVRIERFDMTTGGPFRNVVESASGGSWPFRDSRDVVTPGLIVHAREYEDELYFSLETVRFVELCADSSALEVTSPYTPQDACDSMLASGIGSCMDEDFERLDTVLAHAQAWGASPMPKRFRPVQCRFESSLGWAGSTGRCNTRSSVRLPKQGCGNAAGAGGTWSPRHSMSLAGSPSLTKAARPRRSGVSPTMTPLAQSAVTHR